MYRLFLLLVLALLEQIEQDAAESAAVAAAGNGGRKARKKPAAKKKKKKSRSRRSYEESDEDDEDEDDNDSDCMGGRRGGSKKSSSSSSSSFDWSDLRLRCTAAASAMLRQGDLDRMFAGGSPGQDAVDALCRAGSRILESPAAMKPGASTRQALFELFAVLVQRCPDTATPAVIAGLTEAMAAHEHVAEAAAALCGHLHAATGTRFTGELLMEVVRQIDTQSRLATGGGSASSQQAALKTLKPFGAFLAGLAELLPASERWPCGRAYQQLVGKQALPSGEPWAAARRCSAQVPRPGCGGERDRGRALCWIGTGVGGRRH